MKIGAIILAAGLSSRMGQFKPLEQIGERSLLGHCFQLFHDCGIRRITVVTGHRGEEISQACKGLKTKTVPNSNYLTGMFSSIQCGVKQLKKDTEAFFLLPVDIPLIRKATVQSLLGVFKTNPTKLLLPTFDGEPGHPPLLPASTIPAILQHDGEGGLRQLYARFDSLNVPVWDQGILFDADIPDDLELLRQRYEHRTIPNRREAEILAQMLVAPQGQVHARMVANSAVAMGRALALNGAFLNLELLYCGGLLHDLAKGQAKHPQRAATILRKLGLIDVAEVVKDHSHIAVSAKTVLDERHVVCLADKAISNTTLIEPHHRFIEKLNKFKNDKAAVKIIHYKMKHGLLLQELFERASGQPLATLLQAAEL